jgi:hypothetical protein
MEMISKELLLALFSKRTHTGASKDFTHSKTRSGCWFVTGMNSKLSAIDIFLISFSEILNILRI